MSADGTIAYLPVDGESNVGLPGVDGQKRPFFDAQTRKITSLIGFGHGVCQHLTVVGSISTSTGADRLAWAN